MTGREPFGGADSSSVYVEIHAERRRAHAKHDAGGGSMERKSWLELSWLPVVVEEVGEVARVLCEFNLGNTTTGQTAAKLREELVQVAAMAAAWIDAIDGWPAELGAAGLVRGRTTLTAGVPGQKARLELIDSPRTVTATPTTGQENT